MLLGPLFGLLR
uniref:Uncharacterized protein n=1 Tax=Arundo donax TaxID=35708 RepID=A0A0A9F1K2_ARUDO